MEINLILNEKLEVTKVETSKNRLALTYEELLKEKLEELRQFNTELHDFMSVNLGQDPRRSEWEELYTLTRHIAAMVDTIRIYQRNQLPF